jgi:hypothetical protein
MNHVPVIDFEQIVRKLVVINLYSHFLINGK